METLGSLGRLEGDNLEREYLKLRTRALSSQCSFRTPLEEGV